MISSVFTVPNERTAVHAPEIAVASTKALLTQMVAVYLIGLHLAQVNGALKDAEVESLYRFVKGFDIQYYLSG